MTINGPWLRPSIWDYKKIRDIRAYVVRQRRYQFSRRRVRALRYLNVGCGPNTEKGFVNLDYDWYPGVDLCWDITRPLPWQEASLEGIYSEHCLEHLSFDGCIYALKEFRRVLKPGGAIRIVVPDGEMYLELYHKKRVGSNVTFPYQSPEEVTPMMCVNRIFRDFTHLYIYDEETLRVLLVKAGFVNITRESYLKGRDPRLLVDTEMRAVESLYIEAAAPSASDTGAVTPAMMRSTSE